MLEGWWSDQTWPSRRAPPTRAERRQQATADTRASILEAARATLLAVGSANLSTRAVAEAAEVPLSQIHYHFGSKQQLILAVLAAENDRLLVRQRQMFAGDEPLWRQWERACDYLDDDLDSGYVRVLQEMIAAGWSDAGGGGRRPALHDRLVSTCCATSPRARPSVSAGWGRSRPAEVSALMGVPFMGAESMILLGFTEGDLPARSALRKIGRLIRTFEEGAVPIARQEEAP